MEYNNIAKAIDKLRKFSSYDDRVSVLLSSNPTQKLYKQKNAKGISDDKIAVLIEEILNILKDESNDKSFCGDSIKYASAIFEYNGVLTESSSDQSYSLMLNREIDILSEAERESFYATVCQFLLALAACRAFSIKDPVSVEFIKPNAICLSTGDQVNKNSLLKLCEQKDFMKLPFSHDPLPARDELYIRKIHTKRFIISSLIVTMVTFLILAAVGALLATASLPTLVTVLASILFFSLSTLLLGACMVWSKHISLNKNRIIDLKRHITEDESKLLIFKKNVSQKTNPCINQCHAGNTIQDVEKSSTAQRTLLTNPWVKKSNKRRYSAPGIALDTLSNNDETKNQFNTAV